MWINRGEKRMFDNNSHSESAKKWRLISLFLILVVVANMGFFAYFYFNLNSKYSNLQQQLQEMQGFNSNSPQYQVIQENISLSQLYENVRDSVVITRPHSANNLVWGSTSNGSSSGFRLHLQLYWTHCRHHKLSCD